MPCLFVHGDGGCESSVNAEVYYATLTDKCFLYAFGHVRHVNALPN